MNDSTQNYLSLPPEDAQELPKQKPWLIPVFVVLAILFGAVYISVQPKSWKADTHYCRGYMTINGKPPVDAIVSFVSTGDPIDTRESRPWGLVNDDGSYTLTTYELFDGAPVGEYAITIRWPMSLSGPSPDRLLGAYSETSHSPLIVKVKPEKNFFPAIDLKNVTVIEKSLFRPQWQFN